MCECLVFYKSVKAFVKHIPAPFSLVSDGVGAGPRVHDEQLVRLRVGVHYQLDVALVLAAALAAHLATNRETINKDVG